MTGFCGRAALCCTCPAAPPPTEDALPGGRRIFERPRWSGAGGLCVQTICALAPGRQPDFDAGHCRKLNDLTDERRSHEALHAAFAGIANNCNKGGSPESTWIKMMTMKTVVPFSYTLAARSSCAATASVAVAAGKTLVTSNNEPKRQVLCNVIYRPCEVWLHVCSSVE